MPYKTITTVLTPAKGYFHPIDKDQLMLGPVERSHPGVAFIPDAEVEEITIDGRADRANVVHMSPVPADEVMK